VIQRIDGLRVAGYSDPFQRLARRGFEAENPKPTPEQQDAFWQWLEPIASRVDIVMVHEPGLAERAIAELRLRPRKREIVFLVGHTHVASLGNRGGVVELNGGSIGAGGTGNLNEHTDYGLARLTYVIKPHFTPLAADLVSIDPDTGSATAERRRLDESKP
jgi:predicted phosphodiesterase